MAPIPKINPRTAEKVARKTVQQKPPVPRQNIESVITRREEGAARYNALIQKMLDIISESEGTDRLDFVSKKGRNIIKTPYDMVSNFGKNLLPKKSPTEMTIREVIDFGRPLVNATRKTTQSSAMGKYQIMANSYKRSDPKYEGNVEFFAKKLGLDIDNQLFTPEIQDQIAIAMLNDRVPSIKSFAFEATDKNLNKVLDELNATWRGVPDSKGKTSKGQNVGRLSVDDIKYTLNNLDMTEEQPETSSTDQQMSDLMNDENNKMDEQEPNAGDKSLANQRDSQKRTTEQGSSLKFVRSAEGATRPKTLKDIPPKVQTTTSGLAVGSPLTLREVTVDTGTKLEDRDGATEVEKSPGLDLPENAASDAFMRENFSIDEEELGIDPPKPGEIGFTADSAFDNIDPLDESDNMIYQDDIVDEEGNIGTEKMIEPNFMESFFDSLFLDESSAVIDSEPEFVDSYGDDFFTREPEVEPDVPENEFQADQQQDIPESDFPGDRLREGGEVKADFDGKDEEEEEPADPPPLAKPKEVADDIPALLSEGEYVLPANVVRYLGVERIIKMHRQVLSEIQQMEDLGMIQNVDENGKPEQDDTEMKFAEEKEPEEGMTKGTIIIASSKPKGMMCPDPLMLSNGGDLYSDIGSGVDSYGDDFYKESEPDPEPTDSFDFGDDFAGDDLGTRPDDDPTVRDYSDSPSFEFLENVDLLSSKYKDGEFDEEGRLFKENLEKLDKELKEVGKKVQGDTQYYTPRLAAQVAKEDNPLLKAASAFALGSFKRSFGMLEELDKFMNKKKAEAWSETKEAKIKEIEDREGRPYDEARDGAEVAVAQRAAFASQSGDPLEQMFAAGSTFVDNPTGDFSDEEWAAAAKQYSDYFNEGGQSGIDPIVDLVNNIFNKGKEYLGIKQEGKGVLPDPELGAANLEPAEAYRASSKSLIVPFENLRPKFPKADPELGDDALGFPRPKATAAGLDFPKEGLDKINMKRFGMAEGGGIMVKKKFSSGGTYVPGVGYRATVRPQSESDFIGTDRSYDDIISGIYGPALADFQLDENPDKRKRQILARYLPIEGFRDRSSSIGGMPRDPYLKPDLQSLVGVSDPEEQEDILRDFAAGSSQLGILSEKQSAQLTKELTNYAIAKRQQYDGFLEGDMANLPKGATNRDALKTIFWKELSFDDTNTSDDVMEDSVPYGQYTAGGYLLSGAIGLYGKPRRPMEAKDFKKMWLTPFREEQKQALDNSKLGKLLDLDGPADIEKINRAQSFLTSQGNDRYINPDTNVSAGYIDNIFNEYRGFKGSPLRSGEKSGSMSDSLMGKTYVKGVGYR